jgi:glycosyltransferase involved in cell wall biosynthesis
MKKLSILAFNYEAPPIGGGGGIGTFEILKQLSSNGHHIDLITSHFKKLSFYKNFDSLTLYRVPTFFKQNPQTTPPSSLAVYTFTAFFKSIRLAPKKKYDLVHSFFSIPSAIPGCAISKLLHLPHFITIIGGDIFDPSKPTSPHKHFPTITLNNFLLNQATQIISISSDIKSKAHKHYKIPPKKPIHIIPFCFPHPPKLDTHKPSNKIFKLITIARLVKRKNIELIIKAVSLLPKNKFHLNIVGDGPEKNTLVSLSKKLKCKNITFTSHIPNKTKYKLLSQSDCFILVSHHEGQGLVFFRSHVLWPANYYFKTRGSIRLFKPRYRYFRQQIKPKRTRLHHLTYLPKSQTNQTFFYPQPQKSSIFFPHQDS